MSEKRISGYKKQLKFIFEKLHEGINPADYRCGKSGEEIIPHATLNDHLKFLEKTGIAYEDKKEGVWYYTWKKKEEGLREEYQNYENLDEYNIRLEHSKKLLERALDEHESVFEKYTVHIYKVMDNKNFNYLLQHLEDGYPDIYDYWLKMNVELSLMAKCFWALYDEAEKLAEEKGYSTNPIKLVYPLWSSEGGMKLEADVQTFLEICCRAPKNIFLNLAWLMDYFISNEHFEFFARDAPEHIHRLYKELYKRHDIFDKFRLELKPVLIKVLVDGEPLRGSCDRCPKITIGRKENKKEGG